LNFLASCGKDTKFIIYIEIIQRQYNELESLLELYRVYGKSQMDKLNDHGSQYLSFFSKQHNVINHKINKSTENPSNGNMEIENEIKKLNELYAYIGECLDERRHGV